MAQSTLKGGCLCGAVRYEVSGEPNGSSTAIARAAARRQAPVTPQICSCSPAC